MPGVIRMPSEDRQRPIQLFGEYRPRQFVGQRHAAERQDQVCPRGKFCRPAIGRADREHDGLHSRIAESTKVLGEFFA